ncbi:MAG TPA: ATP synthase subunit I [Candidatus Saccharimonadales bacterium]|jgi:hypothetical protein|nr:ATP synthase subunit I [Candidatus Saccharimonadales bacterium]
MNTSLQGPSERLESFLSAAYPRILRMAIVLSVAATAAAGLFFGWWSGLGVAMGALVACLNFVWLHYGTEQLVQRAIAPASSAPSKFRLVLSFTIRYIFVIGMSYVILKSYLRMRGGFMVGLTFPIIAAMLEGFYEAVVGGNTDQTSD